MPGCYANWVLLGLVFDPDPCSALSHKPGTDRMGGPLDLCDAMPIPADRLRIKQAAGWLGVSVNKLRAVERKVLLLRPTETDSSHRTYSMGDVYRLGHYFLYERTGQNQGTRISSGLQPIDLYGRLYNGKLEMELAHIMDKALETKKRTEQLLRQSKSLAQKESLLGERLTRLKRLRRRKHRAAARLKYVLTATQVKVVKQMARSVFRILTEAIALPRAPYRETALYRLIGDMEKLEKTAP